MHRPAEKVTAAEGCRLESGTVALALQGGGALGAYTWGVLDALLADGRLRIEGADKVWIIASSGYLAMVGL